uniref:cyclin-dependent kinase n=1 Tax=Mesocestoides corti TaxID=53468 RepID=A0A5K3EVU2_MESCO
MDGHSKRSYRQDLTKSLKVALKESEKRHTPEEDYEESDNGENEDEMLSSMSPREEGEAFSEEEYPFRRDREEGEASSDETNAITNAEQQEREYRLRLAQRKAQREAEAAAIALVALPRSKFDSPERKSEELSVEDPPEKDNSLKPTSSDAFQEPTSPSGKHSHRRSRDRRKEVSVTSTTGKRSSSSRHHHHQKRCDSQPDLLRYASSKKPRQSPDPPPSSRNRSRSPPRDRVVTVKEDPHVPPPLEPSGLPSRLAPGRAPIIDGSQFKYLEEEEEEDDDEEEAHGVLEDMMVDDAGQVDSLQEISSEEHNLEPAKPFYYPSIQGCRSVDEFECLNRIEEGTYGVVYRARDKKTNEIVALKRLKMEKEREGFPITSLREINTLMKAQHENIVTVREIVVGFDLDKIYLVMEYVEHDMKSLMEVMSGPFTVGQVKCLLIQLLRAVSHLHDNWILHRDLKTSNLLLSHKGILKVGDFGLAREYGSPLQHYTEVVVTLWYRAIELLLGSKSYSTPIDLWSVGCIFAEFLLQRPLFPGKGEVDEINMVFRDLGTPNERIWPGVTQLPGMRNGVFTEYPYNQLRRRFTEKQISDAGFDLLSSFLTYCPERRITAEKALSHRYFKERPQAIHPSMMPSWPAKSEGGGRPHRPASPRPPPGALLNISSSSNCPLQEPPPPLGGSRFFGNASKRSPSRSATGGGSGIRGSGPDHGFLLRF